MKMKTGVWLGVVRGGGGEGCMGSRQLEGVLEMVTSVPEKC